MQDGDRSEAMDMKNQILTYRIPEIADPADPRHQDGAAGDVRSAVFSSSEHLLRHISHMLPGSANVELLFAFDPKCIGGDRQSRLRLYLRVWANDLAMAGSMDLLIQRGELSRFYKFQKVKGPSTGLESLHATCDIVRRQGFLEPLFGCEFNAKVPERYYLVHPFTANEKNDYLTLDRVLDKVREPVLISIRVQPADTSVEQHAMTAFVERLHSINHQRDSDTGEFDQIDYLGGNSRSHFDSYRRPSMLSQREPLAEEIPRAIREVHESLCRETHLFFSIRVEAKTEAVARLVGSVFAESAFEEGCYRLVVGREGQSQPSQGCCIAPLPVYRQLWSQTGTGDYDSLSRLMQLATVDELLGAFRPFVASFCSPLCIRKNTDPTYEDPDGLIIFGFDEQGIEDNENPIPRGIPVKLLPKHLSGFGVSGYGKTTNDINIVYQLFSKKRPFMVIETDKREFRAIKTFKEHENACFRELAKALEVYTVGAEQCSPLRCNPLEVPPGIDRDAHIENVRDCLMGVMPVFPALPGILGEALERLYESHSEPGSPPVIADLVAAALEVLSEKSYCGEVSSNIRAALEVRLGDLTRRTGGAVFRCRRSTPSVPHLMSSYSVIELDRLSQDQKCAMVLFILTLVREHLQDLPPADGVRLVVMIEEAHNIFGHAGEARPSEEAADPKAYVADLIVRLLAVLRALGVAVILSDQHPSALDPAAVKGTSTKLAFRQVYGPDREELAMSMLLTDVEAQDLARLKPGEAFLLLQRHKGSRI